MTFRASAGTTTTRQGDKLSLLFEDSCRSLSVTLAIFSKSRYLERGIYDGVPRYRNPNNIFLFRHTLSRSDELGITRQTCLPESELVGDDVESAETTAALSLGREVSGKTAMNFSRLVKTSLQSINLERQARREKRSAK